MCSSVECGLVNAASSTSYSGQCHQASAYRMLNAYLKLLYYYTNLGYLPRAKERRSQYSPIHSSVQYNISDTVRSFYLSLNTLVQLLIIMWGGLHKHIATQTRATRCITTNGKILKQSRDHNHVPFVGDMLFC